jgi:hypothetical protein
MCPPSLPSEYAYSLRQLLLRAGFKRVQIQRFDTGEVADGATFGLDSDDSGARPYMPDSLYVEAVR